MHNNNNQDINHQCKYLYSRLISERNLFRIPQWDYMRSKNIRESLDQEHIQNKKREKFKEINESDEQRMRTIEQVSFLIIKINLQI